VPQPAALTEFLETRNECLSVIGQNLRADVDPVLCRLASDQAVELGVLT
jgi:hypothetical protein